MVSEAFTGLTEFKNNAAGYERSCFESALVMRLNHAPADDRGGRTTPHAKVKQQIRSALKARLSGSSWPQSL